MPLFHQTIQRLKQILRQSKIVNHLLAPDAPREMTTTVIYPRSSLMCTHLSSRTPKQLSTVSDNATRCQLCVRNCELIFFALLFQKKIWLSTAPRTVTSRGGTSYGYHGPTPTGLESARDRQRRGGAPTQASRAHTHKQRNDWGE